VQYNTTSHSRDEAAFVIARALAGNRLLVGLKRYEAIFVVQHLQIYVKELQLTSFLASFGFIIALRLKFYTAGRDFFISLYGLLFQLLFVRCSTYLCGFSNTKLSCHSRSTRYDKSRRLKPRIVANLWLILFYYRALLCCLVLLLCAVPVVDFLPHCGIPPNVLHSFIWVLVIAEINVTFKDFISQLSWQ